MLNRRTKQELDVPLPNNLNIFIVIVIFLCCDFCVLDGPQQHIIKYYEKFVL